MNLWITFIPLQSGRVYWQITEKGQKEVKCNGTHQNARRAKKAAEHAKRMLETTGKRPY